jgi:hypothetical protein
LPLRHRVAAVCHGLVAVGLVLFGLRYLAASSFMPYHAEVVGRSWEALDPGLQRLVLSMLRGAGAATAAGGLALGLILAIPWRRRERWALHGLPLLGLAGVLPLLAIVAGLARQGASTPWPAVAGAAILLVAGWALSLPAAEAR